MVEFLVTTVLALIIFIPTCVFVSQMLTVSTQAKDNFNDFVDILEDVHKEKVGFSDSFMMILDTKSAVVFFGKESEAKINYYDSGTGANYDLVFERPTLCQNDTYCICLVSQPEILKTESPMGGAWQVATIGATYMTNCETLDFNLETLGACTVGVQPEYHDAIYCEKDVLIIERGVADDDAFGEYAPYARNYRRTNLILINEEYKVKISS